MFTRRQFMASAAAAAASLALVQVPGEARKKGKKKPAGKSFGNTQSSDILSYTTRSAKIPVSGFKQGKSTDVNLTLHNLTHPLRSPVSVL